MQVLNRTLLKEYTRNTNITGLSYKEFQRKYFNAWFNRHFAPHIGARADALIQYTEPINSRRFRYTDKLSVNKQKQFNKLFNHYMQFGMAMCFVGFPRVFPNKTDSEPDSIEEFKTNLAKIGNEFALNSEFFRDLLEELFGKIDNITNHFNDVFEKNIFA